MIVWSERPWPIGRQDGITNGVMDIERTKHFQPFVVLREATQTEWEAEYRAEGGDPSGFSRYCQRHEITPYFYEVSVD